MKRQILFTGAVALTVLTDAKRIKLAMSQSSNAKNHGNVMEAVQSKY